MNKKNPIKIVISRTDSIGDVALTLPLSGLLRKEFPEAKIIFLGNTYTKPILKCSSHIDEIWEWAELEKREKYDLKNWFKKQKIDWFIHVFPRKNLAKIISNSNVKNRVGTSHRFYHIFTCNRLVNFTRKKSDLHEAQLNVKLLKPLKISDNFSLKELSNFTGFNKIPKLNSDLKYFLNSDKKKIIFHSKSKGSALEWGVENFIQLSKKLNDERIEIFFTGTEEESTFFRALLPDQKNIFDLSGKMTLDDLIAFISQSDLLLAASTGPLHIAGLCDIPTIGLFSPRRPVHPGRWRPLGSKSVIIEEKKVSDRDQKLDISVEEVREAVMRQLGLEAN